MSVFHVLPVVVYICSVICISYIVLLDHTNKHFVFTEESVNAAAAAAAKQVNKV